MPDIDEAKLKEIEARAVHATTLPDSTTHRVIYEHGGGRMRITLNDERHLIIDSYNRGDSEFYFYAREDVAAICRSLRQAWAEIDEQLKVIAALREQLAQCEGSRRVHELDNHHNALACGYCNGWLKNELTRLLSIEPETRMLREQNAELHKQLAQSRAENERLASQLKEWQEDKDTKAGYL